MEDLLPKDNENIPLFEDGPVGPSEPPGYAPGEMVRCETCLRANPPTRVNCLYCGAVLPVNENYAHLQQPTLRPLEKWEHGYNIILKPVALVTLPDSSLPEAAKLLKSSNETLSRLVSFGMPVPLCRAGSLDEASLIQRRLQGFQLETHIVTDKELQMQKPVQRIRVAQLDDSGMMLTLAGGVRVLCLPWDDIRLLACGQLVTKEVETRDQKKARGEGELLEASEIFTDEAVIDIYGSDTQSFRIGANNFDFSCLSEKKGLLAGTNFQILVDLLRARAPLADYDDSYKLIRQVLEVAWPSERQTMSRGWRREFPGKYSIGSVTAASNEMQFTRYTRLLYHLKTEAFNQGDEEN